MQRFFGAIKQRLSKNILVLTLMGLLSLSGLFIFTQQSALAAVDNPLTTLPESNKTELGLPEQQQQTAYEEATEALQDPKRGVQKLYEEELAEYQESQPDKGLVESAKELVQDITGNS
ncbi:MAG TPA: hypothetical protein DDZ80_20025 [Cyanobacteria bacterium UBA8803]|nr:hypothetical protein [Cyanobacteria bacterium UBA9273]HBL60652.1 hypothetical protein [Cyanobacteria bacterium UBA8803]